MFSDLYADINEEVDYYEIRDGPVRSPPEPNQEMNGIYPSVVNEGPEISSEHPVLAESSRTERSDNYPVVWEGPTIQETVEPNQEKKEIYPSVVNEGLEIPSEHPVLAESSRTEIADDYPGMWESPTIQETSEPNQEMHGIYPSVVNEGPEISGEHPVLAELSQTEVSGQYPATVWTGSTIYRPITTDMTIAHTPDPQTHKTDE